MLEKFKTYQRSLLFYKVCERVPGPIHLRDQLLRAASSISLNLAEGTGRITEGDRRRFYRIALGSIRECQAALTLLPQSAAAVEAKKIADELGAMTYRLSESLNHRAKKETAP
jgi:four helix bundle protein